jgi:hypothetical protein
MWSCRSTTDWFALGDRRGWHLLPFTRNDLNQVLAKIADREPDLRLAG